MAFKKVTKTNHLPKKGENNIFPVLSTQFNELVDTLNTGTTALTTATISGDLTVEGTTTLNGNLVLGDAAADALTVNATTTYGAPVNYSNATGITAFATGGQASATALTEEINNVTTCATAGDSVKLPSAVAGAHIYIKNSGAAALDIFPATSDSIDALAVNLAVRIQPGSTAHFYAKDATVWESNVDQSLTLVSPTTNTGQLEIKATASAGNTVTTITNASQAAARTYTIPDAGANANFAMTEGTQTLNGIKTFGSGILLPAGSVGTPSVQVGAVDTGLYTVSGTQTGFSQDGSLVATFDTSGITADSVRNRVTLGTPGNDCTVVEYGDGRDITAVITVTAASLGAPTAGAASAVGAAVYTFPAGAHVHMASYMSIGLISGTVTTDQPDVGLGSVIASGANATLDAVGATCEDYITGQTAADAAGTATVKTSVATAGALTGISINEAGDVKAVYLNAADTWDAGITGNLTATGTITLKYTIMS